MSDPMRPPMPGGAPQGNPLQTMRQNESVLNPTDMAMKGARGEVRPDMTIREFYQTLGLDVDRNTMKDLGAALAQQGKNANPMNKVQAMAGGGRPMGGPPGMGRPQMPPQGGGAPPDLDAIMGRMR